MFSFDINSMYSLSVADYSFVSDFCLIWPTINYPFYNVTTITISRYHRANKDTAGFDIKVALESQSGANEYFFYISQKVSLQLRKTKTKRQ